MFPTPMSLDETGEWGIIYLWKSVYRRFVLDTWKSSKLPNCSLGHSNVDARDVFI